MEGKDVLLLLCLPWNRNKDKLGRIHLPGVNHTGLYLTRYWMHSRLYFGREGHTQSCWTATEHESREFKLLRHPCWLLWHVYCYECLVLVYYFSKDRLSLCNKLSYQPLEISSTFSSSSSSFLKWVTFIFLVQSWTVSHWSSCLFLCFCRE